MAISSINIKPSSGNATIHNERIFDVAYAIKDDSVNEYLSIASISKTRQDIYADYKEFHGRRLNTKATPIREAVVNLNEHHTMKDLQKLSNVLETKYEMKVLHISIHRDEGHYDQETKEEKINYHAHIIFNNYDFDKHQTVKRGKEVMRELQTDVAKTLGMERGQENSKSVRLDHREYKRAMQEVAVKTKELKAENTQLKYDFREMQKKITALETLTTEQKKELHSLNSQAKNTPELEIKNDKIKELESKIQELTELGKSYHNDLTAVYEALPMSGKIAVDAFHAPKAQAKEVSIQAISALKRTNELKTSNDTLKSDLSVLRADMSVLQASNDELTLTVGKRDRTIQSHNNNQKRVEELLPTVKGVEFSKDTNTIWYARLAEFVKGLSDKIKNLTKENEQLRKENQELKSKTKSAENLAKVKEMNSRSSPLDKILDEDNEAHRRAEAFQKIFKAKSGEEISYKDAYETVNGKSNLVTKEDLQKANQGKGQSRDYGYSR